MCTHTHTLIQQAFYETAFTVSLVRLNWFHDPPMGCFLQFGKCFCSPSFTRQALTPKVSGQLSWYPRFAVPGVTLLPPAVFQRPPCSGQCRALVGLHCVVSSANRWLSSETRALPGGRSVQSRGREGSLSFSRHYFWSCGPNSVGCELQPSLEEHCWWLCNCSVSSHFFHISNTLS